MLLKPADVLPIVVRRLLAVSGLEAKFIYLPALDQLPHTLDIFESLLAGQIGDTWCVQHLVLDRLKFGLCSISLNLRSSASARARSSATRCLNSGDQSSYYTPSGVVVSFFTSLT